MKSNKKGQLAIFVTFFITAIIIIVLSALFAPMGVRFNTAMYEAGEQLINDTNNTLADIDNPDVRNSLYATFDSGLSSTQDNIEVNNAIFQYGWIILIAIVGLVLFLVTRALVEFQSGGFV